MELRHLRYFVAVAEQLNFRKASEQLRVAQPSLSSQIKDLEGELGVQLLDRDTGGVRLTDAGAAFLEESRLILAHAQRAMGLAREAAKGRRGKLTIGYFAPLVMGFMPASLRAFREQFPEVEVALIEMALVEQLTALEAGTIHIGFSLGGSQPLPPGVEHIEVARSPIRAVVGRGHPLARKTRISLAELAQEPLLCLQIKRGVPSLHGEIMRQGFATRGIKTGPIRAIEGADAFRATLESGLGASLIAEIGGLSRSTDLVFKPLKETSADMFIELHALWREGHASQLTANFVEVVRAVAPRVKGRPGRRDE
jgi:DNA-binding transcriptional LysR family regulator